MHTLSQNRIVVLIVLFAFAPLFATQEQANTMLKIEAASVMQNGKLVHIDNSAHNVQRDQPERAAQVIREFPSTNVPGVGLTQ